MEKTDPAYHGLESRILYEDNHLLIACKKAGELVQGDRTGDTTIAQLYQEFLACREQKKGNAFIGVPHRIDRPVSGIVVLAKTSKGLERMSELFRESKVQKEYWALCCSAPPKEEDLLECWLGRDERANKAFITREGAPGAKPAKLRYRYIGPTERYHLVEVELLTGRHHQIRCQLASIGCPIKGDLKYGAPRSNPDGGISLHARHIKFVHPVKKTEVDVYAPLPDSWKGIEKYI